jgi:hypothetical protein
MDYSVFGYFAVLCISSGMLFGIVPALRSSKFDLNEVLKEGARSVGRHRGGRLSAVLVVMQFALTLVLPQAPGSSSIRCCSPSPPTGLYPETSC